MSKPQTPTVLLKVKLLDDKIQNSDIKGITISDTRVMNNVSETVVKIKPFGVEKNLLRGQTELGYTAMDNFDFFAAITGLEMITPKI